MGITLWISLWITAQGAEMIEKTSLWASLDDDPTDQHGSEGGRDWMQIERKFIRALHRTLQGQKHRGVALETMWGLLYFVQWNTCECDFGKQEDLAEFLGMKPQNLSRGLKTLEDVGAIDRVKVGTAKKVLITPEGVFRGPKSERDRVIEQYRNVVAFPASA